MAGKETFRDLVVWRKAIDLTKRVCQITCSMPASERFGLMLQMRRAAVSVASNIAEGNARHTLRDYLQFLAIARGALAELETQMIIAQELEMLKEPHTVIEAMWEVGRMLQGLIESLGRKQTDQ